MGGKKSKTDFKFQFYGLPFKIDGIQIDAETVGLEDIKLNGNNLIEVNKNFTKLHIVEK